MTDENTEKTDPHSDLEDAAKAIEASNPRNRPKRIKPYNEVHQEGDISIETDVLTGHYYGDIGIQVSGDGRVWICFDGQSVIRFNPRIKHGRKWGKRPGNDSEKLDGTD